MNPTAIVSNEELRARALNKAKEAQKQRPADHGVVGQATIILIFVVLISVISILVILLRAMPIFMSFMLIVLIATCAFMATEKSKVSRPRGVGLRVAPFPSSGCRTLPGPFSFVSDFFLQWGKWHKAIEIENRFWTLLFTFFMLALVFAIDSPLAFPCSFVHPIIRLVAVFAAGVYFHELERARERVILKRSGRYFYFGPSCPIVQRTTFLHKK